MQKVPSKKAMRQTAESANDEFVLFSRVVGSKLKPHDDCSGT